jgi:hypothetical protein
MMTRVLPALLAALSVVFAARSTTSVYAQGTLPSVGVPAVDQVMASLIRQDLNSVLGDVEFSLRDCVADATVGSPPKCAAGQAIGTPVQTLFFAQCEGAYMTTLDEVRVAVSNLFAKSGTSSIYAVARGGVFDQPQDDYVIMLAQGPNASGDANGSLWYVTSSGKIHGINLGCPPETLAQVLSFAIPAPMFAIAPGQPQAAPPLPTSTVALPRTGQRSSGAIGLRYEAGLAVAALGVAVAFTALLYLKCSRRTG